MRRRRPAPSNRCLACRAGGLPKWKRLCNPCFRALPFEQRRAIAKAGEEKAPHRVSQPAAEAAAWLAAHAPAAGACPEPVEAAARRTGERVE